ncbi:MAG: shikimate dehydrogenase [Pirellulales bacterium]
MICVSIGRGRHRHMIAEHKHLVEQGAKLVELRLDYINGEVNLRRLVDDRPCPVIVTCRRERDGGKWAGDEASRLMLLRSAIAKGVEYVDLEEDVATTITRYGPTKRIISLHDFRKTPDDLPAVYARLAALDADVVKLATMANNPHDNLRMLELIRSSNKPTVGMCMGEIGTPSRILSGRFGSPFTYSTFSHERTLAPGQLSFGDMKDLYHYEEIKPDTAVYGVIADPVRHSMSPLVHNTAFRKLGVNAVYVPFRVPREDLAQFLDDAPGYGIRGLSVTIPHKESVVPKLSKSDGAVRGIGAANSIVFEGEERLGYNTDYRAAMDSLDNAAGHLGGKQNFFEGRKAMVLGAGGAAKAIAFGLKRRGAKVMITGRTPERAAELAQRLECSAVEWDLRHGLRPEVLINCTPVGMHPHVDESPFDREYLQPSMLVFDTVYNPENTLLVKEARGRNCTVITGVEMFVRQAALQFKLFTGQDPPWELMRDTLKRAIGPVKY